MPIMQNRKGGRVTILATGNETFALADLKIDDETVEKASIVSMHWSTSGNIKVERGSTTVANLTGSGFWNLSFADISITLGNTDNFVLTVPANSTLILDVKKQSSYVSQYFGPV